MKFYPNVFIVKDEYHIVIITKQSSQVYLKIDGKYYYEPNGGILPVESPVHKFIVPQSVLDKAGAYTVVVREVIAKKTYFPEYKEEVFYDYTFKNSKSCNLNCYYMADIHGMYDIAKNLVKPYTDLDFIIINGDFGETDNIDDVYKLIDFIGKITLGNIPVLFVRGNHDTRGKLAEDLYKYVGMDGQLGYFNFTFRNLTGLALDCGEDKRDSSKEYNFANRFELYRKAELGFIKRTKLKKGKIPFAVCHTSFMLASSMVGIFDIDCDLYKKWSKAIDQKNIAFMLCGHIHKFLVSPPSIDDRQSHNYPVITGSAVDKNYTEIFGTYIEFKDDIVNFYFTDKDGNKLDKYTVNVKPL
jgi:hypothetical protein